MGPQLKERNGSRKAVDAFAVFGWCMSTGIDARSSVVMEGHTGVFRKLRDYRRELVDQYDIQWS